MDPHANMVAVSAINVVLIAMGSVGRGRKWFKCAKHCHLTDPANRAHATMRPPAKEHSACGARHWGSAARLPVGVFPV
jgi:hypothetical protein